MAVQTQTECLITLENINKSYQQPNAQNRQILYQNCPLVGLNPGVAIVSQSFANWQPVIIGAILMALRVLTPLVLFLTWTVSVGVTIDRNPRLAQILQFLVAIGASVPARALFLVLLLGLTQINGGLQIGSIVLMMLETMWYVLFNVIAGEQSIPSALFEMVRVYKLSRWQRGQTVILPGIFPYLITGIIPVVDGDWNASSVSEYIDFKSRGVETSGLGATISQSTETGNFPLLLAATAIIHI
ncbi:ABC transporter permease subunit [Allocoleopsis sp.]|uniref:ABC transporter permease subunit n=1 Tax=Allocoleopsis sp. TaxID=3088169 RepID=UPI002FCF22D2